MGWMVLLGLAFCPRLFIVGFSIFDRTLRDAFTAGSSPIGFFVLPLTTLAYGFMWGVSSNVVSGWEWIVVALAFATDILFWVFTRKALRG